MDSSLVTLFLIIGLLSGTAMGILTWRLPAEILRPYSTGEAGSTSEFTFSGSRCCQCQTPLFWYDTVPLLGWMLLKGKCRHCGQPVSTRYPLLEGLCAMMAVICYALHPASMIMSLALFLFFWFVLALSVIDLQHYLLPDKLTLPLLWVGLLFNALFGPVSSQDAIVGAAAGYLILWLLYWLVRLICHKEGIGYGDFKMLAAVGAWCGWREVPVILYVASIAGIFYGLLLWVKKGHFGDPIPFGPALALSGWGCFCWATL